VVVVADTTGTNWIPAMSSIKGTIRAVAFHKSRFYLGGTGEGTDNASLQRSANLGFARPRIESISWDTKECRVSWQSVNGLTYRIEKSHAIERPEWYSTEAPRKGDGNRSTYLDVSATGEPDGYYRIKAKE
jgi:hypothetical protein